MDNGNIDWIIIGSLFLLFFVWYYFMFWKFRKDCPKVSDEQLEEYFDGGEKPNKLSVEDWHEEIK